MSTSTNDPQSIDDLCALLTSADPYERDEVAYSGLAERIMAGEADGSLTLIGDRVAANLTHPALHARTFVPLVLDLIVTRDQTNRELDIEAVYRWRDAFAAWWSSETDLRGYDEKVGWLHAIAHGADFVGAVGLHPLLTADDLTTLLDLTAARVITPTEHNFRDFEDDRLACAMAAVLSRPELSAAAATGWLTAVRDAIAGMAESLPTVWLSNTVRTMNSLYVAVGRGVRMYAPPGVEPPPLVAPHRDAILETVADTLREARRYLG
ncbi:MAG TPA: DUF2785 domain-containing protein [Micromonosporaceae bacterium]|jgi:hypothetical protein